MQLSTLPSVPSSHPAAARLPGEPEAIPCAPASMGATPFSQLLPATAPSSPHMAPAARKPEARKPPASAPAQAALPSWLGASILTVPPAALEGPRAVEPAALVPSAQGLPGVENPVVGRNPQPIANVVAPGADSRAVVLPTPAAEVFAGPPASTPAAVTAPTIPAAKPVSTTPAATPVAATAPRAALPAAATDAPSRPAPANPISPANQPAADGQARAPEAAAVAMPVPAAVQPAAMAGTSAEKIAGLIPNAPPAVPGNSKASDKKILTTDGKQVTDPNPFVGTGVAKVGAVMPNSAPTERQPNAALAPALVPTVSAAANPGQSQAQPVASQPSIPQRAVEAALWAAETVGAGRHQAVSMQFSVGNADLSLRVELKNGEIHTTFRTDSADLRLDLAHEWQSSNPGSGGGSLRLAEPVFTSSAAAASAPAGEGSQQQRGGQGQPNPSQAAAPRTAAFGQTPASPAEDAPSRAPIALSTSLHLQAFA